jgi:hypothetical protein
MKVFCIVHIRDGKIQNPATVRKTFEALKDGNYMIDITKQNKRSNPQNRYYWGLVIPMMKKAFEDLGHELTAEEVHEFLKARFNFTEVINEQTAEMIQIPLSTTRLNKSDFSEYIEKIQRFAAEFLNLVIPDPNEQTEIFK